MPKNRVFRVWRQGSDVRVPDLSGAGVGGPSSQGSPIGLVLRCMPAQSRRHLESGKKLLRLEAADKNVDQVRAVGRPRATLLQRLHELRFGDRFIVRADENAGDGRLDTDGLREWEQTRELLQTFGIGQVLVWKSVKRAHLRVGAIHARDPRCNYTELVHVCDGG